MEISWWEGFVLSGSKVSAHKICALASRPEWPLVACHCNSVMFIPVTIELCSHVETTWTSLFCIILRLFPQQIFNHCKWQWSKWSKQGWGAILSLLWVAKQKCRRVELKLSWKPRLPWWTCRSVNPWTTRDFEVKNLTTIGDCETTHTAREVGGESDEDLVIIWMGNALGSQVANGPELTKTDNQS